MPTTLAFSIFGQQYQAMSRPVSRRITDGLLVIAGSLIVAAMAQIKIPLPFTPVPLSAQTLGVVLVGAALGSRRGAASLALYLIEGAVGLPVFTAGAGLAYFVGPTAGYLAGFIAAAYVAGYFAERKADRRVMSSFTVFMLAQTLILALGSAWLAFGLGLGVSKALVAGMLPFIPGEVVKSALAALALPTIWKFRAET
jgi:biotin transport system substrate-specific component